MKFYKTKIYINKFTESILNNCIHLDIHDKNFEIKREICFNRKINEMKVDSYVREYIEVEFFTDEPVIEFSYSKHKDNDIEHISTVFDVDIEKMDYDKYSGLGFKVMGNTSSIKLLIPVKVIE